MNIFDIFAAASFEYAVYSNLAATDPYQYWQTYKNARTGIGTSDKRKNSSMGIE